MYCTNCGAKISDDAKFCPECGAEVKTAQNGSNSSEEKSSERTEADDIKKEVKDADQAQASSDNNSDSDFHNRPEENKRKRRIRIVAAAIILAAAAVVIIIAVNLTSLSQEEKQQVEMVTTAINDIGTVTAESGEAISTAREEYDQLSDKCKKHIDNISTLEEAESAYDHEMAASAEKEIGKLQEITTDSQQNIDAARKAYASLTDTQRALVSNSELLDTAEERFDQAKAQAVIDKIDAIGTVTATSKATIDDAEKSYNALSDAEKNLVDNAEVLDIAKESLSKALIEDCITKIDTIGEVSLDSQDVVKKAKDAYNRLSASEKKQVTNYDKLTAAEDQFQTLYREAEEKRLQLNEGDVITTSKWEITFKRADITTKITPDNTSGYYWYYYPQDEDAYVDLVFKVKNVGSGMQGISNILSNYYITYDGKQLSKSPNLFGSYGSTVEQVYDWDGLDALDSITLHIACDLPREIMKNDKSISVKLTLDGQTKVVKVR